MNAITKEYRQNLADKFIKALQEKELLWKKEWQGRSMSPINAINNKPYKGINKFWLGFSAIERATADPRWCTFNQIKEKGWKLKKGSKGEKVEYWMPYDKAERKGITWDDYRKRIASGDQSVTLSTKYYTVFNAQDIDGIPPLPPLERNDIKPDELIAKLSKNMNVEILNDGGNEAFYRPFEDKIHMPKPEYFHSEYSYNATALHELAHSTGASHRLNRNIQNMFGSKDYAFEELIAEISSCFMSVNIQVEQDETHLDNHKAYVQGWIKEIKEKPETLIKAIREAEKTANYMDFMTEIITEKEYHATQNSSMEVKESKILSDDKEKQVYSKTHDEKQRLESIQLSSLTDEEKQNIIDRVEMLKDYGEAESLTERDIALYSAIVGGKSDTKTANYMDFHATKDLYVDNDTLISIDNYEQTLSNCFQDKKAVTLLAMGVPIGAYEVHDTQGNNITHYKEFEGEAHAVFKPIHDMEDLIEYDVNNHTHYLINPQFMSDKQAGEYMYALEMMTEFNALPTETEDKIQRYLVSAENKPITYEKMIDLRDQYITEDVIKEFCHKNNIKQERVLELLGLDPTKHQNPEVDKNQQTTQLDSLSDEEKQNIIDRVEMLKDYGEAESLTERDIALYSAIVGGKSDIKPEHNAEDMKANELLNCFDILKNDYGSAYIQGDNGYFIKRIFDRDHDRDSEEVSVELWSKSKIINDLENGEDKHRIKPLIKTKDWHENYNEKIAEILSNPNFRNPQIIQAYPYHNNPMGKIISDFENKIATKSQTSKGNNSPLYSKEENEALCREIKQSIDIVELSRSLGFTPVKEGRLYRLKEHDSIALYPDTNSFSRFSETQSNGKFKGGSVIDLVMELNGSTLQESIELLKSQISSPVYTEIKRSITPASTKQEVDTPFVLPEKTVGQYKHAFAYLTRTRNIDDAIVSEMMKSNHIYEDKYHNAVFCGKDKDDKVVYATRKSTRTNLEKPFPPLDVAGSNQEVGIFVNNNSNTLVVNEAFIDSMSYMTLLNLKGKDYQKQNYLALGGVSPKPVIHHLKRNDNINKVILALDNDEAGKKTIAKIKPLIEELAKEANRKINIEVCVPHEKDFNEDLKKVRGKQQKKLQPSNEKPQQYEMER